MNITSHGTPLSSDRDRGLRWPAPSPGGTRHTSKQTVHDDSIPGKRGRAVARTASTFWPRTIHDRTRSKRVSASLPTRAIRTSLRCRRDCHTVAFRAEVVRQPPQPCKAAAARGSGRVGLNFPTGQMLQAVDLRMPRKVVHLSVTFTFRRGRFLTTASFDMLLPLKA